jgi:alpha-L-fucosidase
MLREPREIDIIRIEEMISLGQRVKSFAVSAMIDGSWQQVASATTIGPRRVLKLAAPVTTKMVRIELNESLAPPVISEVGLYKLAPLKE